MTYPFNFNSICIACDAPATGEMRKSEQGYSITITCPECDTKCEAAFGPNAKPPGPANFGDYGPDAHVSIKLPDGISPEEAQRILDALNSPDEEPDE